MLLHGLEKLWSRCVRIPGHSGSVINMTVMMIAERVVSWLAADAARSCAGDTPAQIASWLRMGRSGIKP